MALPKKGFLVRTDRLTSDKRCVLVYMVVDEGRRNHRYDYKWVEINDVDEVVSGVYQSASAADCWEEGYEISLRAHNEKFQISGETKVVE